MYLSIVIPIYNTGDILCKTIEELHRYLEDNGHDFEILICDDSTLDNVRPVIQELARRYWRVRPFFNKGNRGLGYTLKVLFRNAKGEVIIYLDCDLPFGKEIIRVLLNEIHYGDIVLASRYRGEKSAIHRPRWLMSRLYYLLCKMLFRLPVRDIGSGSVALKREVIDAVSLISNGFAVHAEIFLRASRAGFSIKEIPYPARHASPGSFQILRHGPAVLSETLILWQSIKE
ncbi:MAG: glycosyltransferase family 2 protein [Candidatus Omnitrophica bacterium]|nr:glycosyltransferase family 2 protein [Candidatus Omnitrophota bacterium]